MLIRPQTIEIILDIFSGRPNPSWVIDKRRMKPIMEKIQDLPPADKIERDILGYRGFVIMNHNNLERIPDKIVVYNHVVMITEEGKTNYYSDINDLERYLIKFAEEMGFEREVIEKFSVHERAE